MPDKQMLKNLCKYCSAPMQRSRHKSAAERTRRDAIKIYCDAGCAARYRSMVVTARGMVDAIDAFIYRPALVAE